MKNSMQGVKKGDVIRNIDTGMQIEVMETISNPKSDCGSIPSIVEGYLLPDRRALESLTFGSRNSVLKLEDPAKWEIILVSAPAQDPVLMMSSHLA